MERNLAGIDIPKWTEIMAVNALGPLLAARALAPKLRNGGAFAALSSTMGSIGDNKMGGAYTYRMSKAALNAGLMSLSFELRGRDIAVAALHPGWVKTDMGGAGAAIEVSESVAGLRAVIAGLKGSGPARFLDYQGKTLPW